MEEVRRGRKFGTWVRCIYLKSAELTGCAAPASARVSPWTYTRISPIAPFNNYSRTERYTKMEQKGQLWAGLGQKEPRPL